MCIGDISVFTARKKQALEISVTPKSPSRKTKKTLENEQRVLQFLKGNGRSKCPEIAEYLGLSEPRTRAILGDMSEIEAVDDNKYRSYRIK